MTTFWYDNERGITLYRHIIEEYRKVYKVYPRPFTDLPKFLNDEGYRCKAVAESFMVSSSGKDRLGITMTDEDAVVFLLKWL